MSKNIELHIEPKMKDLGDGFEVRRSLPDRRKRMVGPFIFWDHMGPVTLQGDKELKVRSHPHIGLATITYLFSGEILHRDSLNNEQYIRPGEVNWMTAGKGIVHSERARFSEATDLEGIQLWLALPKEKEDIDPSFVHKKESELPMLEFDAVQLRLIAGEFQGQSSPIPTYSKLFYLNGKASANSTWSFSLEHEEEAAIYIISGGVKLEEESYKRFDLVIFKLGASINLEFTEDTEFMIFGGEPFAEKRYIWWNFVSTSQEKIEQAKEDWKEGRFSQVINETEFIPLPE